MASLPDNLRIYAVGDIHGRADLLAQLLEMIAQDDASRAHATSRLVFLGDYIDRGPDSHGVVEILLHGLPEGWQCDFLMGNHERMMMDALADVEALPLWIANGGAAAVKSYVRAARTAGEDRADWGDLADLLPPEHRRFFDDLRLSVEQGDFLFVHAGVRPGIALERQDPHDLVWIRRPFLDHQGSFGKVIVHGHTPVEAPEVHLNRIAIDTGAVFTGRLTALVLEGSLREFLTT